MSSKGLEFQGKEENRISDTMLASALAIIVTVVGVAVVVDVAVVKRLFRSVYNVDGVKYYLTDSRAPRLTSTTTN